MTYETWRVTFQSSEQAARAAYAEWQASRPPSAGVPKGWEMKRKASNRITIECEGVGFYVAGAEAQTIAGVMMYALADALTPPKQDQNDE